ncbi:MAG: phytanoyl-CoA dioxygenase family protein [Phycisphaerae bacterium]
MSVDPQAVAQTFRDQGIVILPGFFDPELMKKVAAELDGVVAADPNRPWGSGPEYARLRETKVQVWSGDNLPSVKIAFSDPRLHAITEAILGANYRLRGCGIFSTPYQGGQGWHQDSRDRAPGHYELNRIIFPKNLQPEQGGLVYVPGSFRGPDLPPGGNHESLPGEKVALPTAGTLVLMHTLCYHRVQINQTHTPRTQCNSRAQPLTTPEDICAYPIFRTGPWNFKTGKPE